MATEIVRCPLQPGRDPDDADSEAGQALKDCLEELTQQEGFQRLYWGREVENPDVLRFFIDWDSVGSHEKFTKSSAYKPFTDRLNFVLDMSKIEMYHVEFTPHPPESALSDLSSPMTEILTAYFPSTYSSSDQETFSRDIAKLISAIESSAGSTYHGSAGGWVHETVSIPDSEEEGKLHLTLIGWDSVAAHLAFRDTQAFAENIGHLRGAKDLKAVKAVHASHVMVTRGGGVGG